MDEELFNIEVRKFLKRFGVTSQREIEKAVGSALEQKKLRGDETLGIRATLEIPGVLAQIHIDGDIRLSGSQ